MKSKFLSVLSISLLLALSGCQENGNSNSSESNKTSIFNSSTTLVSTSSISENVNSSSSIDSNKIQYVISVYLSETENVGEGVRVQLCKSGDDGSCTSVVTNALGQAIFSLEPGEYKIDKIEKDGYTFDLGLKVNELNPNKKVVLEKISNLEAGDGSETSPFAVSEGYYNVTVATTGDIVFYSVTFTKEGKHVIQSLNRNLLTDPKVGREVEDGLDATIVDYLKSEVQYGNFTIELDIKEEQINETYTFGFTVDGSIGSKAKVYPISIKSVA